MAFNWRNFRYTYDPEKGYKYPDFQNRGEILEYFSERGLVTTMGCTSPACPPTPDEIGYDYCVAIAELNHRNGDTGENGIPSGGGDCGGSTGFDDKDDSSSSSPESEDSPSKPEESSEESKPEPPDSEESEDPLAEEAAEEEENTLDEMYEVEIPEDEGELQDMEANQELSENPNKEEFEDMVNRFMSFDPEAIAKATMALLDVQKERRESHRESLEGKRKSMDQAHAKECLSYNKEYTTECQKHKDDIFVSAVTKKLIEELTPDKVYDDEIPIEEEDDTPPEEAEQEEATAEQNSESEAEAPAMKGSCGGKKGSSQQNNRNQNEEPSTEPKDEEDAETEDSAIDKALDWLMDEADEALDDYADRELGQDLKEQLISAIQGDLTGEEMEHLTDRLLDRFADGFTKDTLKELTRDKIDKLIGKATEKLGFGSTDKINIAFRNELTNAFSSRALKFCADQGYTNAFYMIVNNTEPDPELVREYLPTLKTNTTNTISNNKTIDWLRDYANTPYHQPAEGTVIDVTETTTWDKANRRDPTGITQAPLDQYMTHNEGPENASFLTSIVNMVRGGNQQKEEPQQPYSDKKSDEQKEESFLSKMTNKGLKLLGQDTFNPDYYQQPQ